MDRRTERSIKKALDLIRKGEHPKARPILLEILKEEPGNADAWFLLSYAVPERGRRIYALRQALNFNPDFDRARERLSKLSGIQADAPARPQRQPGDSPAAPAFKPPDDDDEAGDETRDEQGFTDEERAWAAGEDFDDEGGQGGGRSSARTLLVALVVVALLAAAYFLAGDALRGIFSGGGAQPTATEVVAFRTLPPTWTQASTMTATPEPTRTPNPTSTPTATPTPTPTEEGSEP